MAEPRGPLDSPGFWLHHAALAWNHRVDALLRPLGLTHTQFNLLASTGWLQRHDGPPTQQQVADLSGSDRVMASKVLTALERRALLVRQPDPDDVRAKRLTVTPAGRELVLAAVREVAVVDEEFFGDHGPDRSASRDRLRALAERRQT